MGQIIYGENDFVNKNIVTVKMMITIFGNFNYNFFFGKNRVNQYGPFNLW
jgi:hypothetical protein